MMTVLAGFAKGLGAQLRKMACKERQADLKDEYPGVDALMGNTRSIPNTTVKT
ncbi:MAG: hypothetical protein ACLVK1_11100 [Lachnospiraceae bacterium]